MDFYLGCKINFREVVSCRKKEVQAQPCVIRINIGIVEVPLCVLWTIPPKTLITVIRWKGKEMLFFHSFFRHTDYMVWINF